ncbi:16712_t:CDS:2 [Dentiscutata erythropus]|uniref:16712_t:CDS:1 n=1 Tax=Dentiscutata erythropus TaxID=1348616 RepID=A0A9N9CU09_9GLOM|nr:16712_t:CDS:2 [Dentiscutata erythropus]
MGCFMSKLSEKAESIKSRNSQKEFRFVGGRRFHNVKDALYPLPNDEEESDRLHLQHFLIRYIWQSNFSVPIEHTLSKPGSKILDIGCGAASWSFDIATSYPSTNVVGLDISPYQPTQIKPSNFTFAKANVLEGLPFEDNTFDFVFQRYLISGYSKENWPYIINELVRVLKPGGYLEKKGVDWDTYQKLEEYAQNQGQLENIKKEVKQCYHGLKSNDIELSKLAISNTTSVYISLKPSLTKALNISDDEFDELIKTSKDELFEFDTYYNIVRVYARKI